MKAFGLGTLVFELCAQSTKIKHQKPKIKTSLHPSSFLLHPFFSGRGVTLASEFWKLVVTVQFCPPGPKDSRQKAGAVGNKVLPRLNWMGATLRTSRLWVRIPPGAPKNFRFKISDFKLVLESSLFKSEI
jgi:hypothetical protein